MADVPEIERMYALLDGIEGIPGGVHAVVQPKVDGAEYPLIIFARTTGREDRLLAGSRTVHVFEVTVRARTHSAAARAAAEVREALLAQRGHVTFVNPPTDYWVEEIRAFSVVQSVGMV